MDFVQKPPDGRGKTKHCWDPRESPQLIWAGKAGMKNVEVDEETSIEVPVVNLHIHERVAPEAIIKAAQREDAQRTLFADPELGFKVVPVLQSAHVRRTPGRRTTRSLAFSPRSTGLLPIW